MVSIKNLSVEFSSKVLFNNINFVINKKEKIALVGKNGAGKSTLLKIISGLQSPTSGSISAPKNFIIGYLPQHINTNDTLNVIEEVRTSLPYINDLKNSIDRIQSELIRRTDYESLEYNQLIENLSILTEKINIEENSNSDAEIEKILLGLGFSRNDFSRKTAEFSGGWRMRIELAKVLVKKPDLILLDEPTNHLDIESIQWLEKYLITKSNAVILVSHDKAFIDNVTNRTIEISLGKIYDYNVNYSKFIELRKERVEQQLRAFQNQQKQIQETEEFIEKFRYKATKSVQVQSRIKQLAKIERIEVDEFDNSKINLKFLCAQRSGDYPLIIDDLSKAYGEKNILNNITFTIKRGEKIAFVGKNGAGKSTMIKCIMNEIPYHGTLKIGHNVKIGYFAQNQAQLLDDELTVFDTIDKIATGDIRTKIRDILGAFMFGGEESEKKIKVLSGGERARVAIMCLLLEPFNFLILDEPTNHLDIKSKEVLKEAIKNFNGTVIIVSHDRDFLNGIVDKIFEFKDGRIKEYIGDIYEFLSEKNISVNDSEPVLDLKKLKGNSNSNNIKENNKINKISYFEQREKEKMLRGIQKKITNIEEEISVLETELHDIEQLFNSGKTEDKLFEEYDNLKKRIEDRMSMWEIYIEELNSIEK